MKRQAIVAMAAVMFGVGATTAQAQTSDAPVRVTVEPAAGQEASGKAKSENDWGFRWDGRPSLRLGEGTRVDFQIRLQGDLADSEVPLTDVGDRWSGVDLERRRIGLDGEIFGLFDYQLERELNDERDPWRDVYLNYKQFSFAAVQVGKFKLPFSLDENTSATNLDFIYRSRIASILAPGRDQGAMVHGRVLQRGLLRYEFGIFKADGSNAHSFNEERVQGDRTVAARFVVQPFRATKTLARDVAFGTAFTRSDIPEGISGLRGRTELDEWFYQPEAIVNGVRRRVGLEARWRPGPFSIKSEYIRLTDERLGEGIDGSNLPPLIGSGWYLSGTWAVTGEKKADGVAEPRRPLFGGPLGGGYVGAIEIAARVERIRFGSLGGDGSDPGTGPRAYVILGNSDRVYTVGVNWYANRWIKVQANLVRNVIANPEQGPLPGQPAYWSRIIRFQFSM